MSAFRRVSMMAGALATIAASHCPAGAFSREPSTNRPADVQKFAESLQNVIYAAPRLDSCLITSAELGTTADSEGESLILRGVIVDDRQRRLIENVAAGVLGSMRKWKHWYESPRNQLIVRNLVVRRPDSRRAKEYYRQGLRSFFQEYRKRGIQPGEFPGYRRAMERFSLALRNDPTTPKYAYWRVLTAVHMGQNDRARALLKVFRSRNIHRDDATFWSFEYVQGPLRTVFETIMREKVRAR